MVDPTTLERASEGARTDLDTVAIIDYGSQYTPLIARRVRESEVYSEIVPFDADEERLRSLNPKGIILSGSDSSVYESGAPRLPDHILQFLTLSWRVVAVRVRVGRERPKFDTIHP